jgi:hypothetical protein
VGLYPEFVGCNALVLGNGHCPLDKTIASSSAMSIPRKFMALNGCGDEFWECPFTRTAIPN